VTAQGPAPAAAVVEPGWKPFAAFVYEIVLGPTPLSLVKLNAMVFDKVRLALAGRLRCRVAVVVTVIDDAGPQEPS
jgi:hypothetical protein